MKTWKRALALVLALVMALSLVALPSFAAGEEDSAGNGSPRVEYAGESGKNNGGLVMTKTVRQTSESEFLLTLEAYATGETRTETRTSPWTSSWSWTSPARWTILLTDLARSIRLTF